jgi:hypothetical protein
MFMHFFMLDDSMRGHLVKDDSLSPLEATLIIMSRARYYAELHNAITIQHECNILLSKVIFLLQCPNKLLSFCL